MTNRIAGNKNIPKENSGEIFPGRAVLETIRVIASHSVVHLVDMDLHDEYRWKRMATAYMDWNRVDGRIVGEHR